MAETDFQQVISEIDARIVQLEAEVQSLRAAKWQLQKVESDLYALKRTKSLLTEDHVIREVLDVN